jgi:hypothetical protein
MSKKYALILLLFFSCSASGFAQMAMPEMSIRKDDKRKTRHVPAETWDHNPSSSSAESAHTASAAPENFTMQLSPNPTYDAVQLELFLPQASRLSIALVGRDGKLIRSVYDVSKVEAGAWNRSIRLDGMPAGLYYVRMRVGEEFHSLPVVKL